MAGGGNKQSEFGIEVALGNMDGYCCVNKFGRALAGVQLTATDIWDRADATPTQQIWVAPTQARVHAIVSTDAGDAAAGVGARTVRVYGLTSWDASEVSEVITMAGATPVNTVNSYVIIHRMKVLTKGATNVNVGAITATAATDGSVTAAILAGAGQTQMAIYGVPSLQRLVLTGFYASLLRAAGAAVGVDVAILVNPEPDAELTNFVTKRTDAIRDDGSSAIQREYDPPVVFDGPCIVKIQCTSTTADQDVSAGFDAYMVAV